MSALRLEVAVFSDPGQERERNEDAGDAIPLGDGWLLGVCDGMGGHEDGHVASATALATIAQTVRARFDDPEPYRVLHDALCAAHDAVRAAARGSNMGTTAVLARVVGPRCWYGWVGDSRFYLLREGRVVERSEDHTRVAELLAEGVIGPEEAANHPDAGMLRQALGAGMEVVRPTVYEEPIALQVGDALLLCSDGLHDLVRDEELPALCNRGSVREAAQGLVATANGRGGHDNITVVVARVVEAPPRPPAPAPSAPGAPAHREAPPVAPPEAPPAPPPARVPAFLVGLALGLALGVAMGSWWATAGASVPDGATPGTPQVNPEGSIPERSPEGSPPPTPGQP